MTTRVDFYVTQSSDPMSKPLLACKLAEKAYKLGHQVYILTESKMNTQIMDDLLWTFRAGSFVPHEPWQEDKLERPPILIGEQLPSNLASDVLVNLSHQLPQAPADFRRVIELVNGLAEDKTLEREHYRYYRDQGYELNVHRL